MNNSDLDILADMIASRISIQPRWMSLKQAATYSNIGQKELVRLAESKSILGFQDDTLKTRPWIFDKKAIDRYRTWQADKDQDENEKIALELVNSLEL